MIKAMDYEIVACELELQSHYYVHFRINTIEKGMRHLILPDMGSIVPLLSCSKDLIGHKVTYKDCDLSLEEYTQYK